MINSYEYITQGNFLLELQQTDKQYTIISDIHIENPDGKTTLYSFQDIFGQDKKKLGEKIIYITQHFSSLDMASIDKKIHAKERHWISLHPGVMSLHHKNNPEDNDINRMIDAGYLVQEPYYHAQIIDTIVNNALSYHRIHDAYIPQTLYDQGQKLNSIVVTGKNIGNLTVLSGVSCIDKVASALHTVSNGSLDMFDLYARSSIQKTLDKPLQDSINKSKRVLVVLDHKATEEIRVFIDSLLREQCGDGLHIHYLFPQYHITQSILPEYIYEEAHFNEQAMVSFVENILVTINNEQ